MKWLKQCIIFLAVCLLCGCWDNREMEDRSYIITMGIDKNQKDGRYVLTLAPAQLSATGSQEENTQQTKEKAIAVTGDTLASAIRQADTYSSRQVYLGQLKTVVLGKEILKDEKLLK